MDDGSKREPSTMHVRWASHFWHATPPACSDFRHRFRCKFMVSDFEVPLLVLHSHSLSISWRTGLVLFPFSPVCLAANRLGGSLLIFFRFLGFPFDMVGWLLLLYLLSPTVHNCVPPVSRALHL